MYPGKIIINDSCPRDGWQKFKDFIPTETKIKIIKGLIDSGSKSIEMASMSVRHDNPPFNQFSDAETVVREITDYAEGKDVFLSVLINGEEAAERALKAGVKNVNFFVPVSEVFAQTACKTTVEGQFARFEKIAAIKELNVGFAAGAVFGSPFGDPVPVEKTLELCGRAVEAGTYCLGLADSAGMSDPANVRRILSLLVPKFGVDKISCHLHNTRGMGLANAFAALEEGVYMFDAALGGMGGCPYIKGAKGNIATEDLLNMAKTMNIQFDNDLDKTIELASDLSDWVDHPVTSSMVQIYRAQRA